MKEDKYITNTNVTIHYIIINKIINEVPLIMIPGTLNSADEIYEDIKNYVKSYCILISLRGRGKSSAPAFGYTLNDHVSDIDLVISSENLSKFFIFGHSVGGSIALKYSIIYSKKVLGVIIGDYLPVYPKFTEVWIKKNNSYESSINKKALLPIMNDSKKENLFEAISQNEIPVCILKSDNKHSPIKSKYIKKLESSAFIEKVEIIENSEHDLLYSNASRTLEVIYKFMNEKLQI